MSLDPLDLAALSAGTVDIPRGTRCALCTSGTELVTLVNRMIVGGATYAEAYRALASVNEARVASGETEISYQTVLRHGQNHLPVKAAAYREIVERRARAARLDPEEGLVNILTEAGLAEAVMTMAYQGIIESGVVPTPSEGLAAAKFLNQLRQAERGNAGLEAAFAELGYIIKAVKDIVPQEYWPLINARIDEQRGSQIIDAEVDDEFDPGEQPEEEFNPPDDGEDF